MKIALFGGSFDPVHIEHVRFAEAAKEALGLDEVIVMPAGKAPHKLWGASADGEERLAMCRIAFRSFPWVRICDEEKRSEGTSYSYLTCRRFARNYPDAERYFLVGSDMLEDFFTWKNPDDILTNVTLAACGRSGDAPARLRGRFRARFGKEFVEVPFSGSSVSSRLLRVDLAFRKKTYDLNEDVWRYIVERGLYTHPAIAPALALEKEARREHSYRVARMAVARASDVGVSDGKALLASALHDCGKYVSLDSPLLKGFTVPENVPAPVVHQFTGAFLAQNLFQIDDDEVLDAIRYHTSGKADMTILGMLVFLADMLEDGREFFGVDKLREWYWKDLEECFYLALRQQNEYLERSGKSVYPLTKEAYHWIEKIINTKKVTFSQ